MQTLKWYKGTYEFYRYEPRNYPQQKKFFSLPELYLDVSIGKIEISLKLYFPLPPLQEQRCDSKSVVLVSVHADMSGYYTCEVTTQRTFETVTAKQYLLVVREYHHHRYQKLSYIQWVGAQTAD